MRNKNVLLAEMLLLIVTVIWGIGFPLTSIVIDNGISPLLILSARFSIASVVLTIIYFRRLKKINKKTILYGSLGGVLLFSSFYFQTLGIAYTSSSNTGFITQLNIVFVPFIYYYMFHKQVSKYNIFGVILAIIGLFILTHQGNGMLYLNAGDFLTLICALIVAFYVVLSSYFQKKHNLDSALYVMFNSYVASILALSLCLFTETIPPINVANGSILLILGVFNTAFGFCVQSFALKLSTPVRISLIVALESLFGAVASIIMLGELLTINIVLGGLLIIMAVVLTEVGPALKVKN